MELLISYKRGEFLPALFPNHLPTKHFHIADVSDGQVRCHVSLVIIFSKYRIVTAFHVFLSIVRIDVLIYDSFVFVRQIFVCVIHNESLSNLYVGNEPFDRKEAPKFSLSLERIVFFKPNLTWSDSWLK